MKNVPKNSFRPKTISKYVFHFKIKYAFSLFLNYIICKICKNKAADVEDDFEFRSHSRLYFFIFYFTVIILFCLVLFFLLQFHIVVI